MWVAVYGYLNPRALCRGSLSWKLVRIMIKRYNLLDVWRAMRNSKLYFRLGFSMGEIEGKS